MKTIAAALFTLTLFSCSSVIAQAPQAPSGLDRPESGKDSAPASAKLPAAFRATQPVHKFFDLRNSLAISSVAASLAGDGWSTQRALALPGAHEVNPVARSFVSSRAGEIAYSGAGFALVTGGMYLAHKTNHHKWERIGPFALAGWEGFLTAWNLHQISRAQASH